MPSKTFKWRVTFFSGREEYVYADEMQEAYTTARNRVRFEDGEVKRIELYNHGEQYPWGLCYVAHKSNAAPTLSDDSPNDQSGGTNHV